MLQAERANVVLHVVEVCKDTEEKSNQNKFYAEKKSILKPLLSFTCRVIGYEKRLPLHFGCHAGISASCLLIGIDIRLSSRPCRQHISR